MTLEEVMGFASTKEGADASKGISDWLIVFLCSIVNSCLVKMERERLVLKRVETFHRTQCKLIVMLFLKEC